MFIFEIGFRNTSQKKILEKRKKITEFIVNETLLKVSNQFVGFGSVAINSTYRRIGIHISIERNMNIAERFLKDLEKRYGKHSVSTDGRTGYPNAYEFLKLEHNLHSPYEMSIMERTIQYLKDRTEGFDNYFHKGNTIANYNIYGIG